MTTELAVLEPETFTQKDLAVYREPNEVLAEAKKAANALVEVISKKKNPVKFNGEQYLEFEDWQTLGKFYGLAVKITATEPVNLDGVVGFLAKASVVHIPTGQEISAAEAMCLNDERNWRGKPLFQLRSMAQTRAGSKAFRNVLAWVVVLAGYRPTPSEEMSPQEEDGKHEVLKPTEKQMRLLYIKMKENGWLGQTDGKLILEGREALGKLWGYTSSKDITAAHFQSVLEYFSVPLQDRTETVGVE